MTIFEDVRMAKSIHQAEILSRPNVVGLGIGYKVRGKQETDELSVVVMVRKKLAPVSLLDTEFIPSEVNGIRIDVIEVGDLRSQNAHTGRMRPAPGGVSIGHYKITAGTMGCIVRDRKSGARLILSNNHVLANRNDGNKGDPILQPGPADGGVVERDTIALLERFEQIKFNQEPAACSLAQAYVNVGNTVAVWLGSDHRLQATRYRPQAVNVMDAALARPILETDTLDDIMDVGEVVGVKDATLGMTVVKSGRTTGMTSGIVNVLDATVTVGYGESRTAAFENQIVTTPMSEGGDSGSLMLESGSGLAVGLLFGGSGQATLFNPIQAVLDGLQVDFPIIRAKSTSGRRTEIERIQAVKDAHLVELLAKPNVVGVGIKRVVDEEPSSRLGLVVMVTQKLPALLLAPEDIIPSEIDGVPVEVQEVGEFSAQ